MWLKNYLSQLTEAQKAFMMATAGPIAAAFFLIFNRQVLIELSGASPLSNLYVWCFSSFVILLALATSIVGAIQMYRTTTQSKQIIIFRR
jgi:magnesium-transporting ATPase (P-type)